MSQKKFQRRKPNEDRPAARKKVMELLARRNYSIVELHRKLSAYEYDQDEINDAVEFAETNKWLAEPEDLSEQITRTLHRKKKSARYIDHFLRDKGLPAPEVDPQAEFEKALDVVQSKLLKEKGFDLDEKKKIQRLLTNRGFDSSTIRKVLERK